MTTQTIRQQNYGGYGPILAILLMVVALLTIQAIQGIDQTNEAGVSGGHANHEDTLSEDLPGICPGCSWPDCGDCNGKTVLTLQATVYLTSFPTFDPRTTPVIPGPANGNVTAFPTLAVTGIPTGLPTPYPTADIWPTEQAPPIPTIERSIRDVDRPDGTGGGLD